jgi:hypothetical protein
VTLSITVVPTEPYLPPYRRRQLLAFPSAMGGQSKFKQKKASGHRAAVSFGADSFTSTASADSLHRRPAFDGRRPRLYSEESHASSDDDAAPKKRAPVDVGHMTMPAIKRELMVRRRNSRIAREVEARRVDEQRKIDLLKHLHFDNHHRGAFYFSAVWYALLLFVAWRVFGHFLPQSAETVALGIMNETGAWCARRRRAAAQVRMMTYKTPLSRTIMRVAGSATSAMRKPQNVKRVRNDEA